MKIQAKDFFLNIGYAVTLYVLLFNFIFLGFALIDLYFTDADTLYFFVNGGFVKFNLASAIVVAPAFFIVAGILRKHMKGLDDFDMKWRKWLLTLTVFLASVIVVIDLITLVYTYLNGEQLLGAFIAKALFALAVFVCVALFYIKDLKGYWNAKRNLQKQVTYFAGALVFIFIVANLAMLGSPYKYKLLQKDFEQINGLQSTNNSIARYYEKNKRLPDSLDQVKTLDPYPYLPKDINTQDNYKYTRKDETNYTICAYFNLDFPKLPKKGDLIYDNWRVSAWREYKKEGWVYKSGETCFDKSINDINFNKQYID